MVAGGRGRGQILEPRDLPAEEELLRGAFSASAGELVCRELVTRASESYFVQPHNIKIYMGLKAAVHDTGNPSPSWREVRDAIPANSKARETLMEYASSPLDLTPSRVKGLMTRLERAYRSRRILELVREAESYARNGEAAEAYTLLMDGVFQLGRDASAASGARYLGEYVDELKEEVERRRNTQGMVGIRTGIQALDRLSKGLQRKHYYLLGGRPGMGKSLVVGQVALNVAKQGKRVLLCSAEMAAEQYIMRMACTIAGVDYERFNGGLYDEEEARRIRDALDAIRDKRVVVNEAGTQNTHTVRQDIIRYRPDLVIIDYMQQFQPSTPQDNEYRDVTKFSKELNAMKKDFNVPILACVQLSRNVENREDKRPTASDIRATGQLEQDADLIVMLYRPREYARQDEGGAWILGDKEVDPEEIHFICAKNRHGRRQNFIHYIPEGKMWVEPDKASYAPPTRYEKRGFAHEEVPF